MLKTYSDKQMLAYWKRRLGLEASASVAGENDLTDFDRKLLDDIDIWYADLLENAPADRLPTEDVAGEVACHYSSDNSAVITLPQRAVRMVSLKMADWGADEVETYSIYSDVARLQRNRLTRADVDDPIILRRPGALEVHGLLSPLDDGISPLGAFVAPFEKRPELESLKMVVRPEEGTYILDPTLLRRSRLMIH